MATLPPKCEQTAAERLSAMELANTVKRGTMPEIRSGTVATGYRARCVDPSCNGQVIMNFTSTCVIENMYTRGNCRIQGMSHW